MTIATFTTTPSGQLTKEAVLTIDGQEYQIPDKTRRMGVVATARIADSIAAAGYQITGGDFNAALRGLNGIEVEPRP